jgi:hypothetical protein
MRAALVLHGVFVAVFSVSIFFVRAKQARREMDERMAHNPYLIPGTHVDVDAVPMEKMGSSTSNESTGSVEIGELVGEKSGGTGINTIV